MNIKQYQKVRIIFTVVLAMIISQSIVVKNYFIPIILMIVSSLILMYLRRKVVGIIADERDYGVAGKSALLAIQIYAWVASIGMLTLYALHETNPAYEPVAITLAFSTCILMLLYSGIFHYYNRFTFSEKNKKVVYIILAVIVILVGTVITLRVFSGEDNWNCQNGVWIKHGNPSFSAPTAECK